jgi:hypothetical protein
LLIEEDEEEAVAEEDEEDCARPLCTLLEEAAPLLDARCALLEYRLAANVLEASPSGTPFCTSCAYRLSVERDSEERLTKNAARFLSRNPSSPCSCSPTHAVSVLESMLGNYDSHRVSVGTGLRNKARY